MVSVQNLYKVFHSFQVYKTSSRKKFQSISISSLNFSFIIQLLAKTVKLMASAVPCNVCLIKLDLINDN